MYICSLYTEKKYFYSYECTELKHSSYGIFLSFYFQNIYSYECTELKHSSYGIFLSFYFQNQSVLYIV